MWYFGKVPPPQAGHTIQEVRVTPVGLVTRHPLKAQSSMRDHSLQPFQGQLWLGFVDCLFGNPTFLPSLATIVVKPLFRQKQAVVQQRVSVTTDVGPEHTDLAVLHFAQHAAPLPSYPDRVLAFLGKGRFIDDIDCVVFAQRFIDQLPVLLQQLLVLPSALANELLHGLNVAPFQDHRHWLDRLLFERQHQSLQILVSPVCLLSAVVQIGKLCLVIHQFVCQCLDLFRSQLQRRRRLIDLDNLKFVNVQRFPAFLVRGIIPQKVTL